MNKTQDRAEADVTCDRCKIALTLGKVTFSYMGNSFPVELLTCRQCGLVFVPEELALGKMLQVEKALEDK